MLTKADAALTKSNDMVQFWNIQIKRAEKHEKSSKRP